MVLVRGKTTKNVTSRKLLAEINEASFGVVKTMSIYFILCFFVICLFSGLYTKDIQYER